MGGRPVAGIGRMAVVTDDQGAESSVITQPGS
jgi:hypothetical protein